MVTTLSVPVLLLCLAAACGGSARGLGELVVVINSDLTFPKDIDKVGIQIVRAGTLQTNEVISLDHADALPLKFEFGPGQKPEEAVSVHVTAWKAGQLRIVRDAKTTMPKDERRVLVIGLNWLCDGLVQPNGNINDLPSAASSCPEEQTCIQGTCGAVAVPFENLLDPDEFAPPGAPPASCLNVQTCFEGTGVSSVNPDPQTCSFESPPNGTVGLNVAIELPFGDAGVCSDTGCLIPLDGFRIGEGWSEFGNRIGLPPALCVAIEAGRVRGLRVSTQCATKTVSVPICAVDPKPTPSPADAAVGPVPDVVGDAGAIDANETPSVDAATEPGVCPSGQPAFYGRACGSCGGTITCDGSCSVATRANYGQSCGSCGGKIKCDGSCSVGTPANFNQSCGSCGGKTQCDGSCSVATPANFNQSCGSCGGKIKCDGSCSVDAPANFNQSCGSCGGKTQCDGSCSVSTPGNFNQSCGSCGGKTQCDGSCNVATPENFNQSCGSCGGKIKCDGSCSVNAPANFDQSCGSCGGKTQCDGSCSVSTPSNFNQSCGSCGGKIKCDGSCSVAAPANLDQTCGSCGGKTQCDGSCSVATPPNLGEGCNACRGEIVCDGSCRTVGGQTNAANAALYARIEYLNGGEPLPRGRYRATYVDGCMRYGTGPWWSVHAYDVGDENPVGWFLVGATASDRVVRLPGAVGFDLLDFEDCVTASKSVAPVDFNFAGGQLGVWLYDVKYSDNTPGIDGRNPRWNVVRIGGCN